MRPRAATGEREGSGATPEGRLYLFEFFLLLLRPLAHPDLSLSLAFNPKTKTLPFQRRNVRAKAAASERPLWFPGACKPEPLGDGFVPVLGEK